MAANPESEKNLAGSALQEKWFFTAPCSGASQNVEPPVIVSISHSHSYRTGFAQTTVGCPFLKRVWKDHDNVYKCVAPIPKDGITEPKALRRPNCVHKIQL
jgi:hypothetical protein